jgi:CheY-like chemotaxis protein
VIVSLTEQPILIVEDNPDDRILLQRAFRRARLANPVHMVTDGEEAVAYLLGEGRFADREANPFPVLVLLDLKLPRRSGLEVLKWMREHPTLRRLPVVVLTSSREQSDINVAYDLGANSYLTKPVAFDALIELVSTLNLFWFILSERPQVEA